MTWEREIQANLGLTTRIDSVETPGPYTVILRGVEFLNVDGESILETVETRIEFGKQFDRVVITRSCLNSINRRFLIERFRTMF